MREFKVIRLNTTGTGLYEDYLMFKDEDAADHWAIGQNEERPGSILDVEEIANYNRSENKYEY